MKLESNIKSNPLVSILIPTYNGAAFILPTLHSLLSQDYRNFEIIIQDDCSTDSTLKVIKKINDPRVKIYQNAKNLGYSLNLEAARTHASGDIIFLMGQDDILADGALKTTLKAFDNPKVGAVTRPYFWFDHDINFPVRAKKQLNSHTDQVVKITDSLQNVVRVFESLDQLSGLAYRAKFFDTPFHPDIFPCHVYPFAAIFKKHPVVYLRDFTIAVRIASSQTRSVSSIYNKSPLQSWKELFDNIFPEKKFIALRRYMIRNFVANNYVGLIQIKNYARYRYLLREVALLVKYRPSNIFVPMFWLYSLLTILTPPSVLIPLTDWYKSRINSKTIPKISFDYNINQTS